MPLRTFQQLPIGLDMWPQVRLVTLIFLGTFVLEDAAAVTAGLLVAAGSLRWSFAFAACFLGIWIGDIALYAFARIAGRNFFERTLLRRFSSRTEESERWFAEHGNSILIFSRVIPGARLPTYLAAGFLRLSFNQFLTVTGMAVLVWTTVILELAQVVGTKLLLWASALDNKGWVLAIPVVLIFAALRLFRRFFVPKTMDHFAVELARWRHWEFWPAWLFYFPVGIYCIWLALKYRGPTLPTAANPGIFSGGIVGESKMATLKELMAGSPEFTAETWLIAGDTFQERLASLRNICGSQKISIPFVLKPDIGQRGAGIKVIQVTQQAEDYLRQTNAPLVVQRYVPGPLEAGIFYYRFPGEKRGHVLAITEKIFPIIVGDGRSTVAELIWKDLRARFMAEKYLQRFRWRQDEILPAGQTLKLVEAGNHAQGCIFRDGMRLCTPALVSQIDEISQKISGFFFGRYDIRFVSESDLIAGEHFQIIELNGAASEATSIYDARNSLFDAYRVLFRQWDLVFAIGAENRKRGCTPTSLRLVWRKWREYSKMAATYPGAD